MPTSPAITSSTVFESEPLAVSCDRRYNKFRAKFEELPDDADVPNFLRKYKSELRFPEKLMLLMMQVEQDFRSRGQSAEHACITWTHDDEAFIIRNERELLKRYLPAFFGASKFTSFTRKLYRWGFRQKPDNKAKGLANKVKIFFHPFFKPTKRQFLIEMQSKTVEGTRRTATVEQNEAATSPLPYDQQQLLQRHVLQWTTAAQERDEGVNHGIPRAAADRSFQQHLLVAATRETLSARLALLGYHPPTIGFDAGRLLLPSLPTANFDAFLVDTALTLPNTTYAMGRQVIPLLHQNDPTALTRALLSRETLFRNFR